jgi:hypothetical protein
VPHEVEARNIEIRASEIHVSLCAALRVEKDIVGFRFGIMID